MKIRWALFVLLTMTLFGCASTNNSEVVIVPSSCNLQPSQEFPLSLKGSFPNDAKISWQSTKGIVNPSEGLSVVYTAPLDSGTVIITAIITTSNESTSTNIVCNVQASSTNLPTPPQTPTQLISQIPTIAITEIEGDPCGGDPSQLYNEYVELFNYGDEPNDVNGWWIATSYRSGSAPSKIVTWDARYPGVFLGNRVMTNTTIVNPKQYAVVLAPEYYLGSGKYAMPYFFPSGTIILTIAEGNRIGNESNGIQATGIPPDTMILYEGSDTFIQTPISTYGSPSFGTSPQSIRDDGKDNIPFSTGSCNAVKRIVASGPDTESNWQIGPSSFQGK